jgi:hypothetical protein
MEGFFGMKMAWFACLRHVFELVIGALAVGFFGETSSLEDSFSKKVKGGLQDQSEGFMLLKFFCLLKYMPCRTTTHKAIADFKSKTDLYSKNNKLSDLSDPGIHLKDGETAWTQISNLNSPLYQSLANSLFVRRGRRQKRN